jgi:GT2 family glycosyltransferase
VGADVAVVVVTHNSAHVIGDLLASLPEALGDLTADVFVVDNASTDETPHVVRGRSDCQLIESSNVGYAAAINLGYEQMPGCPSLLVLNPDVRLGRGSVQAMWTALQQPRVGVVAPLVLDDAGELQFSLRREPSLLRAVGLNRTSWPAFSEYVGRSDDYRRPRVVDWALGAVLLVSRSCYWAVGGWDPSYFLYSEETDFCLRARDAGYVTVFEPGAVVHHIGGQSGQSPTTHAMQIVNRVRLYRRRHGVLASSVYFALTLVSELTWTFRGGGSASREAVLALLFPGRRPGQLGCSISLIPR